MLCLAIREEDELAAQAGVDRRLPLVVAVTGVGDHLTTLVANDDGPHALW